jgi:hypothetical protein
MLIPYLHSGLGNQLFQFSAAYSFAKNTNRPLGLNQNMCIKSSHSTKKYSKTIFSKSLSIYGTNIVPNKTLNELHMKLTVNEFLDLIQNTSVKDTPIIGIDGYFQKEQVIRPYRNEIVALLDWGSSPQTINDKYGDLSNAFFIHYRRGDYVGTAFWRDLDDFYLRVINRVRTHNPNAVFYIISDDINYYRNGGAPYLSECGNNIVFVHGLDEIETLYLMKTCGIGGAAPNSTFSWWGLYLNYNRPLLCITSCVNPEKYKFPEATVIETAAEKYGYD